MSAGVLHVGKSSVEGIARPRTASHGAQPRPPGPTLRTRSVHPHPSVASSQTSKSPWKRLSQRLPSLRNDRPLRPPPPPRTLKYMIVVLQSLMFMAGWQSGSNGPLIPHLQTHYHIGFAVSTSAPRGSVGKTLIDIVSLIWITNFLGILTTSLIVGKVVDRIGHGYAYALGMTNQAIAQAILGAAPPYPVFCLGYFLNGTGQVLYAALVNSLLARLPNATTQVGIAQSAFGLGACVGPLVATKFASTYPAHVNYYFFVSMSISLTMCGVILVVLQGRRIEEIIPLDQQQAAAMEEARRGLTSVPPSRADVGTPNAAKPITDLEMNPTARDQAVIDSVPQNPPLLPATAQVVKQSSFIETIRMPYIRLVALYLFQYTGCEVAYGGWIVTFMIDKRKSSSAMGYIASGYYGSLALGRLLLIPVTRRLGARYAPYAYSLVAAGAAVVVWTVDLVAVDAVAIIIIGASLGPIFPLCINTTTQTVPRRVQTGAVAFQAACGSAGQAVWPLVVGLLAQRYSISVLQPVAVALIGCSIITWAFASRYATFPHEAI